MSIIAKVPVAQSVVGFAVPDLIGRSGAVHAGIGNRELESAGYAGEFLAAPVAGHFASRHAKGIAVRDHTESVHTHQAAGPVIVSAIGISRGIAVRDRSERVFTPTRPPTLSLKPPQARVVRSSEAISNAKRYRTVLL